MFPRFWFFFSFAHWSECKSAPGQVVFVFFGPTDTHVSNETYPSRPSTPTRLFSLALPCLSDRCSKFWQQTQWNLCYFFLTKSVAKWIPKIRLPVEDSSVEDTRELKSGPTSDSILEWDSEMSPWSRKFVFVFVCERPQAMHHDLKRYEAATSAFLSETLSRVSEVN